MQIYLTRVPPLYSSITLGHVKTGNVTGHAGIYSMSTEDSKVEGSTSTHKGTGPVSKICITGCRKCTVVTSLTVLAVSIRIPKPCRTRCNERRAYLGKPPSNVRYLLFKPGPQLLPYVRILRVGSWGTNPCPRNEVLYRDHI